MSLICLLSTWLLCVCKVMFIKLVLLLFCLMSTCLWTCCKQNAHETYLLFFGFYFGQQVKAFFFRHGRVNVHILTNLHTWLWLPVVSATRTIMSPAQVVRLGYPWLPDVLYKCSVSCHLHVFQQDSYTKIFMDLSCASFCLVSFAPLADTHICIDFSLPCYFKHHLSVSPAVMIMLSLNCTGACICRSWLKHDRQGSAANSEYFSYKWPSPIDVWYFEMCIFLKTAAPADYFVI